MPRPDSSTHTQQTNRRAWYTGLPYQKKAHRHPDECVYTFEEQKHCLGIKNAVMAKHEGGPLSSEKGSQPVHPYM